MRLTLYLMPKRIELWLRNSRQEIRGLEMICDRCGHQNEEGANFCSSCGEALAGERHHTLSLPRVEGNVIDSDLIGSGAVTVKDEWVIDREALGDAPGMLIIKSGPGTGSTFLLDEPVTTVGRHPDSGVFLDDITVSRRHAELIRDENIFLVKDVGSLNGTYLNRERVEESQLSDGDELQIGRFKLVLVFNTERNTS